MSEIVPNDSMAEPDPEMPLWQGGWCAGCGQAIREVPGASAWTHVAGHGPRCEPREAKMWQRIKSGDGL